MIPQNPGREIRLREKLLQQGADALSDQELLAVFISRGNRQQSCLELAAVLLQRFGNLRQVLNADWQSFKTIPGLGLARYAQLQALVEIRKRSDFIGLENSNRINTMQDLSRFLKQQLRDKKNETLAALFLDAEQKVLAFEELFQGTIDKTSIHPRPIVQRLMHHNAKSLILAHNHPSGSATASPQDIAATKRLKAAFELMDVELLDHLVIGDNQIYSIQFGIGWEIF